MNNFKGLSSYLLHITTEYKLDICINDFVGFLQLDTSLFEVLQPYLIHKNAYCMQVKSDRQQWDKCLNLKRHIHAKSQKLKKAFLGMCYCGVWEYIIPIICDEIVIGVICVGEFCYDRALSMYRLRKSSVHSSIDLSMLVEKFDLSTQADMPDISTVESLLSLVADYISMIYSRVSAKIPAQVLEQCKKESQESYIMSHAIEFIRQNYTQSIMISDVCHICHCSESYLSHIFKKKMKLNLKAYINKIRIEHAKALLLNGKESICEVAMSVGFNDPNYFSNVFTKLCGVTPTEYKKRCTVAR